MSKNTNKIPELHYVDTNDECQLCGEDECEEIWKDNNDRLYYYRACDPNSSKSDNDIITDFLNRQ